MRVLRVPDHVHSAEDENGCVTLLNEHTGQWHVLNQAATRAWRIVRGETTSASVVAAIAAQFPGTARETIESDVESLLETLVQRGLMRFDDLTVVGTAWSEVPMAPKPDRDDVGAGAGAGGSQYLAAAAVAFPAALVLARLPFSWTVKTLRQAKRVRRFPDATAAEAEAIAEAVRRISQGYPGRVACYEISLSTAVAAMLLRRNVDLLLGTATDPRRFHAWIETRGHAVADPEHAARGDRYQPVLRV